MRTRERVRAQSRESNVAIYNVSDGQSIQDAIDLASDGDTIILAAGTYNEHVLVDKAVTIEGANSGVAGDGLRGAESTITGGMKIAADNAVIDGVLISGSYDSQTADGTDLPNGMLISAANVTVENSQFIGGSTITGSEYVGTPVEERPFSTSGPVSNLSFTNNYVHGWGEGAYIVEGHSGTISGNVFDGNGNGVVTESVDMHITGNTFGNSVGAEVAPLPFVSTDISDFVDGNTFLDHARPITVYLNGPDGQDVTGSDVPTTFHVEYHGGDASIEGGAGSDAISFSDNSASVSIDLSAGTASTASNAFNNPDSVTFTSIENATGGSGDDVLTGDSGANSLAGGDGLDTAGYATTASSDATIGISGGHWTVTVGGETDTLSGIEKLAFSDHTVLLVDNLGSDGGLHSLQTAIDDASNGDTILVAPGSYTESANYNATDNTNSGFDPVGLLVNKSVTIQGVDGTGAAIADAGATAATVNAAIESDWGTNFFVTAADVTIKGLDFEATDLEYGQNPESTGQVNKAFEVVADNFTLENSYVGAADNIPVGASVYVNDRVVPDDISGFVSAISSFHISNNILEGDFSEDNGAGYGQSSVDFQLTDNDFVLNPGTPDD